MAARRGTSDERLLCAGPGRLCQALGVTGEHDGLALDEPPFAVLDGAGPVELVRGPRVGITRATELPWRYCERGSRFLSPRGLCGSDDPTQSVHRLVERDTPAGDRELALDHARLAARQRLHHRLEVVLLQPFERLGQREPDETRDDSHIAAGQGLGGDERDAVERAQRPARRLLGDHDAGLLTGPEHVVQHGGEERLVT